VPAIDKNIRRAVSRHDWPSRFAAPQCAVSGTRFRRGSAMRWLPGIMRLEAPAWTAISFAMASASFLRQPMLFCADVRLGLSRRLL
jgi:hypothetical protein